MDDSQRRKYQAQLEKKRIRDSLELRADYSPMGGFEQFDELHEQLTPMQSAIFFMLEMGFSPEWIRKHFEYDKATWSFHLVRIRRKLKAYLEEQVV